MFLWCNNLASSSKTARRIVFMVKHMPSPAIRRFNMTCLFENTKLYLHTVRFAPRWGYIGVPFIWGPGTFPSNFSLSLSLARLLQLLLDPTFIRSVDFSRFHPKRRAKIQGPSPKLCGSIIWNKHWITGEGAHSDPRFGEAKPKEFRGLALFGQAVSWMILPCMKIWKDFLKWFDFLAVLEYFFF